nr:7873_t:CDS:10 [Entrophospora candida]
MFDRCKNKSPLLPRQVFVNEQIPPNNLDKNGRPKQYVSNKVKTSKYTVFTFIPKNLYEQFRRIANFFFLTLVILQWFPEFATISPVVAALPMFIITGITAIKDAFEDFKRHVTDRSVNNRKTWTLGNWINVNYPDSDSNSNSNSIIEWIKKKNSKYIPNTNNKIKDPEWKQTMFKNVRVGDFIKLFNDDFIPADIIILSTSEPNSLCYVETKNLDGETNLKIRQSAPKTSHLKDPRDCTSIKFYVDSEPPTTDLFSYNAALVFPDDLPGNSSSNINTIPDSTPRKDPINLNSILLRGCVLKNTEWVIGLVVFTGTDTKLSLNSGETPSKRSRIEKKMNPQVIANLSILALMCVFCAIATRIWQAYFTDVPFFDSVDNSIEIDAFLTFWNALITFQNIVPISLYLSIEFVKSVQAYFIFMDDEMKYAETNTPCIPKNWNLSDDLGQVEYIFSDKTGTLTRNVMEFRKCSIGDKIYHGDPPLFSENDEDNNLVEVNPTKKPLKLPFVDSELSKDLSSDNSDSARAKVINDFFTLLAICHTVLISTGPDGEIQYKAQSPDEAALVQAAKDVGFTFCSREQEQIVFTKPNGEKVQYKLLNIIEFTSARKRMSIIVQCPKTNKIILFSKGADNVIFERLKLGQQFSLTAEHLEEFAKEGLRTLCLGYAEIDPQEYQNWDMEYKKASTALENREKEVAKVADKIESNLTLLGATAIEDRLQDGVPECIATLKRAGIKIWVLTGDKMETAISIGFSTCLLSKDMNLIIIRGGAYGEENSAYQQMCTAVEKFFENDQELQEIVKSNQVPPVTSVNSNSRTSASHVRQMSITASMLSVASNQSRTGGYALVIDGVALTHALKESFSKKLLLNLACRCKGVICCRVSPLQKAQVVELVKEGKNAMTCAIGDGANDVSMIQAAHIGIGVAGEEGLQAVMASDYAMAQFKYLTRLLLVHGHYAYIRNSSMILNFFYKNMIGVAVLAIGVFDRDVPDKIAIDVPELYQWGIKKRAYTMKIFLIFMFEGIYQSLIIFFIPYLAYSTGSTNTDGREPDQLEMGTTMAVACITMANLFTGFNAQCWTVFHFVAVFGSIGLFLIYICVYSLIPISPIVGFIDIMYTSGTFYFSVLVALVISILPRYLYKYYQRNYRPTDIDIIQEICKKDPTHDFTKDKKLYPTLTLTRQTTRDSRKSVPSPRPITIAEEFYNDQFEICGSMTNMVTGLTEPMRGYAFSQEEGSGRVMLSPQDSVDLSPLEETVNLSEKSEKSK